MEAKVISFQDYKQNRRLGGLTLFHFYTLWLSIGCVFGSGLVFTVILSLSTSHRMLAILMILGIVWAMGFHIRKLYRIFRFEPIHKHCEYLSYYPIIASPLSGIVTVCLLLSHHFVWAFCTLCICVVTTLLYVRMNKMIIKKDA